MPLSYRSTRVVYLGDDPIRIEILEERVRQALLNSSSKEVFLRGDGGVQLQELMDVMDRLKAAGVEKVGIVSKTARGETSDARTYEGRATKDEGRAMDAVSPILIERAQEPQGLRNMVVVSLVVHAVVRHVDRRVASPVASRRRRPPS